MMHLLLFAIVNLVYVNCAFVDPMKHEITLVTPKNLNSLLNRQRDALSVTLLLHYSEKISSHADYITKVYNEAAKDYKGMMKFLAIDCSTHKKFCETSQQLKVIQEPIIHIYPASPIIPVEKLEAKIPKETILQKAVKYIPGEHIQKLTADTFDGFVSTSPEIPKLILYSSKDSIPIMMKALSNSFKDRILFGVIPGSEKSLDKKMKVKTRPAVYLIRSSSKKPETYTGAINFKDLHAWINIYAETFVKGGGFVDDDRVREQPAKPWLLERFPEITGESFTDLCVKSNSICLVYLVNKDITKNEIQMIHSLIEKYAEAANPTQKFRWGWMNLGSEKEFAQLFKIPEKSYPSIVALNMHKRPRYFLLPSDKVAISENIDYFMEKLISGDGRFTVIKSKKVPTFAPRRVDSSPSSAKEEF